MVNKSTYIKDYQRYKDNKIKDPKSNAYVLGYNRAWFDHGMVGSLYLDPDIERSYQMGYADGKGDKDAT